MSSCDSDFTLSNAEADMSEDSSVVDPNEVSKELADLNRETPTPSEAEDLEAEEEDVDPRAAYQACIDCLSHADSELPGSAHIVKYRQWMSDVVKSIDSFVEFQGALINLDYDLRVVPDRRLAKVYREFVDTASEYLSDSLTELPKVIRKCVDRKIKEILEA